MPDNFVFLAFGFLLEKCMYEVAFWSTILKYFPVYVASFLAMLNARERTTLKAAVYTSQTALESHGISSITVKTPTTQARLMTPSPTSPYPVSPSVNFLWLCAWPYVDMIRWSVYRENSFTVFKQRLITLEVDPSTSSNTLQSTNYTCLHKWLVELHKKNRCPFQVVIRLSTFRCKCAHLVSTVFFL